MPHVGRQDTDFATYTTAAAVVMNRLVKLDTNGLVSHAAAIDQVIGTALRDAAIGDPVAVRNITAPSLEVVASGVIGLGAAVAGAADGKVVAGAGVFQAVNAATADGDVILIVPTRDV